MKKSKVLSAQQRGKLVLREEGKLQRSSNFWVRPYKTSQAFPDKEMGAAGVHTHTETHTRAHGHTNSNAVHAHLYLSTWQRHRLANLSPYPSSFWLSPPLWRLEKLNTNNNQGWTYLEIHWGLLETFLAFQRRHRYSWYYPLLVFFMAVIILAGTATRRRGQRSREWAEIRLATEQIATATCFSTAYIRKTEFLLKLLLVRFFCF